MGYLGVINDYIGGYTGIIQGLYRDTGKEYVNY